MFDIFVIESEGEFYYSIRSGTTGFRGPDDAVFFRSAKAAGAKLRSAARLMSQRESITQGDPEDVENLRRWQVAEVKRVVVDSVASLIIFDY